MQVSRSSGFDGVEIVEPLPQKFGFQLSKLFIVVSAGSSGRFPADLFALLTEATQHRLEKLDVGWEGLCNKASTQIAELLQHLQPIAPHLRELSLPISNSSLLPAATSFFRAATKLTELKLSDPFELGALSILSALPPSLTSLVLDIWSDDAELINSSSLQVVRRAVKAAPELRLLKFGGSMAADRDHLEEWIALVEECARK